ncbi:MAG: LysE family transporter, partial [Caldilineaceae bacterium]|nr:LysE family transporter [Caldilineaceae bacterium]
TDLPIIVITVLFLRAMPPIVLSMLALFGGAFVLYLAVETMRHAADAQLVTSAPADEAVHDLRRGTLVNLLSPHPWLFWIGVGGPLLLQLAATSWQGASAFLLGFYGLLIGSKVILAAAVAGGRHYLSPAWYRRILFGSGMLLGVLGIGLLWDALR